MRDARTPRIPTQFCAMSCVNEIITEGVDSQLHSKIVRRCIDEIGRIERKYSRYLPDSILSKINDSAANSPFPLDHETAMLLSYADEAWKLSSGMFDITTGILRRAWDFKIGIIPSDTQIENLKARVGWDKVEFKNHLIKFLNEGMEIDLGGIGKEYAVDRVIEILKQEGASGGSVNLGGDVRVFSTNPESKWRVGVRHPRVENGILLTLDLANGAVATSGDYERFFIQNGKRYCHILNPVTGYPVDELQSVTVLSESCLVAGTLATSTMVMGEERGVAFLQSEKSPFYIVKKSGEIINYL